MRKATKTIISFAVVLIAGLNFIVPAFAQDPFSSIAIGGIGGASGAGLFGSMAGMSGIDIAWPSSGSDPLDAMWNVLNPDHVYFSGEKHEASGVGEDVWDYITVDIGDWLDAQSDFIINFAQTNNVTDNSSGTISDGFYSYSGYPFNVNLSNNNYRGSAVGSIGDSNFTLGDYVVTLTGESSSSYSYTTYFQGSQVGSVRSVSIDLLGTLVYYLYNATNQNLSLVYFDPQSGTRYALGRATDITADSPTTIAWTSGVVNTSVFDGWESAKVKIPHNISGLNSGWSIPDFTAAINNIWTNHQQGQIVIEDTDTPIPPPPVPTTPLGEVPFDDWVDLWGQGIYQQLENQSDALDLIGSNGIDAIEELESIDTNTQDIEEAVDSIDTNIGIGNGILGGIRSLAQSAVDFLEGIAEHVGELVEEIVEGTETLIAGILNQIPQAFGVIFGPIKQASSIWHYVVEWIQSIGAPFQFIWSMASGTSYYIILPVYASLAASVVLAFYKRFGK